MSKQLIKVQQDAYDNLVRTQTNFKKSPKDRLTKTYLETRLERVEQLWTQFTTTHTCIIQQVESKELSESSYYKDDVYFNMEELYLNLKCDIKTIINKLKDKEVVVQPSAAASDIKHCVVPNNNVKLPRITIPIFSGKYTEWPTFRDLFLSAIHKNTTLDKVQKLHYLKSYLTGEAEQLLRHVPVSEANYDRCWSQLETRYNNKKYLSHCILRRLLSQRNIVGESAGALKDLIDTTVDCLGSLNNLGIDTNSWDILIIHILTLKLDSDSRREWELNVTNNNESDQLPTFDNFKDFLTSRYRALEFLETKFHNNNKGNNATRPKVFHIAPISCAYCNADHFIGKCKQFCKQDGPTRRKFIQEHNLCFNCMGHGHAARQCKRTASCKICKRRHHSLLHAQSEQEPSRNVQQQAVDAGATEPSQAMASHIAGIEESNIVSYKGSVSKPVLLATALVKAVSTNGSLYTVRALLDQGSQASFVTEDAVQSMGLKKKSVRGTISGIGGENALISNAIVEINIHSRIDPSKHFTVSAYVLKSITALLPNRKVEWIDWAEVDSLPLADPTFHTPNRIDMLFGAEVYTKVLQEGLKRAPDGSMIAQCTTLGWIISGSMRMNNKSSNIRVLHAQIREDELLKRFWEMEREPNGIGKRIYTEEENKCEEIFTSTTVRDNHGRYVVHLPFRTDDPSSQYGNSRAIALRRFHALESKFDRNIELKESYKKVIQEYLSLGHMRPITEEEKLDAKTVYLPHHAVVRNDKDTTKVRVVFDASCKLSNGRSLNDDLMIGASLQPELRHLIMKWRIKPICLVADITKMYRQVWVTEKHTNFQRIVWRDSKDEEIKDYKLLTVTFGQASAPFLAVRSMQQAAKDEGRAFPRAAEIILTDYYMDDLMTGCQNIDEGLAIYNEMNSVLIKAGFELQKWSSNCDELLEKIANNEKGNISNGIKIKQDEMLKTLGLTWNRSKDSFQYLVQLQTMMSTRPETKRKILSDIARLFDPLGWVAPVTVIAKVLIQKLWIIGIGWDKEVPDNIQSEWDTYRKDLQNLNKLVIPRWLNTRQGDRQELHGFADASKTAYAAVVYARTIDRDGEIHVRLITAKTNVAPIKTVSIPRLELCGAVLLAKLLCEVAQVMNIDKTSVYAWTDSEIVLAWINNHPSKWKPFIANRVSEILCTSEPQQWHHVRSKQNPADIASRGMYPSQLLESQLWLQGPSFLMVKNIEYKKLKNISTSIEEVKVHLVTDMADSWIWDKYGTLIKLVRVVAYCRRVLEWKIPKEHRKSKSFLSSEELTLALEMCIRECQGRTLQNEISIAQNKTCKTGSNLKSLTPYLDNSNILRVGGRLEQSSLSTNQKHPILLPNKSHFTNLVIANAHHQTLHGGPQLMLSYLGTKYFILGAKRLVKAYVGNCVTCRRYNASSPSQLMGQLPRSRVTPSRPFRNCGVDYAGPINLRTSKGRGHHSSKGYICLFICMATKAIHLEVVSDLTTQGFLAAYKRFVARRGHCREIWSDNGTNFQGASKELQLLLRAENSNLARDIAASLANTGTTWHFIPPHAPNHGGLWEAGVKSCKQHLRKIVGNTTLTYEEMATLLSQIEACLNSRPLCRITDANATDVLTPAHFLIGESLINAPEYNYEDVNITSLKRWQILQKLMQTFWRRWSSEYLTTLLQRHKWCRQTPEPNIGDVVLVKEDNLPPSKWLLGRVTEKHPGPDRITRVVTLRANNSSFKRPTSKLCVLPVNDVS